MSTKSGIGERIKEKRKAERLSAEDLAIKLNINRANVYKWEKGSKPSDPEEYKRLMDWLNNGDNVPRIPEQKENDSKQNVDSGTAIENLSQSNLILARSVEKAISLIGSVQPGNPANPQLASDLQSLIQEIASGKKQMSMEDVQKRLNKVLVSHTSGR